jgi:hypothetical protein
MKKHVEVDHCSALMKKLIEDPSYIAPSKTPNDQKASKKRAHVSSSSIWDYFYFKLRKDDPTQVGTNLSYVIKDVQNAI